MKEVVNAGKSKSELLIEIDFMNPPDGRGVAPALKKPPEFKIKEAKLCYEGSRPLEPDWFNKNEDGATYDQNISMVHKAIRDIHGRLGDEHLLGFVRAPTGDCGAYRIPNQEANVFQRSRDGGAQSYGRPGFWALGTNLWN